MQWDAAVGLYRTPHREDDPTTDRWTTLDPSGLRGGDANEYRVVGNDPTNGTDPTGLEWRLGDDITPSAIWNTMFSGDTLWFLYGRDGHGNEIMPGRDHAVEQGHGHGRYHRLTANVARRWPVRAMMWSTREWVPSVTGGKAGPCGGPIGTKSKT